MANETVKITIAHLAIFVVSIACVAVLCVSIGSYIGYMSRDQEVTDLELAYRLQMDCAPGRDFKNSKQM